MANSVDPDQTAPIGAVCSGSMLFPSIPYKLLVSNVRQLFAANNFSRQHFQMHFFFALYGLRRTLCAYAQARLSLLWFHMLQVLKSCCIRKISPFLYSIVWYMTYESLVYHIVKWS